MKLFSSIRKRLWAALLINIGILFAELIGYFVTNSLALLGDAGHVATDVLAISSALIAVRLAAEEFHDKATFGYHRAEVISAFFNSILLLLVCGYIFYRAYGRFIEPEEVVTTPMLIIASVGLVGNAVGAYLLHGNADINVRGAYLHLLADTFSSIGVVIGTVLIIYTGNHLIDPIISIIIAVFVVSGAVRLLKESISIIMHWTPEGLNVKDIVERLENVEGVREVHDVHIWTLCSSLRSFSAHVVVDDQMLSKGGIIKAKVRNVLHEEFNIQHTTLEIECDNCGDDIVQTICHPPENHVH